MDIIDLSRLGISGLFILLNLVNYFRQRKLKKKIKDYSDWIWLTVGFEIVILCLEVIIILILDQGPNHLLLRWQISVKTYTEFLHLEARKFKKGVLLKFCILIKIFCFKSNLDQTWSDCSTHEYCNLTKFGQDWTENKKF